MKQGQTQKHSVLEAMSNIVVGFGINYACNIVILPLCGVPVTYGQAFHIGVFFTFVSLIRQYVLRRWFNKLMIKTGNDHKE